MEGRIQDTGGEVDTTHWKGQVPDMQGRAEGLGGPVAGVEKADLSR